MPSYHIFQSPPSVSSGIADYLLAGDGIYGVWECMGVRVFVPVLPCEVRGLPQLSPVALLDAGPEEVLSCGPSYHFLTEASPVLPPLDPTRVYQYVVGREGAFLLAKGTGLEVLMPISPAATLPGLASVSAYARSSYPPVDEATTHQILERSWLAHNEAGQVIERLFYLLWDGDGWRLHEPVQDASMTHVRAREATREYVDASIEGHSHHTFTAHFSHGDDRAEVENGLFRVTFVLGCIFTRPQIRVRICAHGYAWEVPAAWFFALPPDIVDCVASEWEGQKR